MTASITPSHINSLAQILGAENISDEAALRALYSQDIWAKGELADFITYE